MQGTQVQSLVREDPTCHGAAKACVPRLLSLSSAARSHLSEKPEHGEQTPLTATRESLHAATKAQCTKN